MSQFLGHTSTESGTGVTHDPLCTWRPYEQVRHTRKFLPCQCDIIAKVREDERQQFNDDGTDRDIRKRTIRERTIRECIAVAEYQHMYMSSHSQIVVGFDVAKSEILRALRALQEKP